jgi:hypothetical protein
MLSVPSSSQKACRQIPAESAAPKNPCAITSSSQAARALPCCRGNQVTCHLPRYSTAGASPRRSGGTLHLIALSDTHAAEPPSAKGERWSWIQVDRQVRPPWVWPEAHQGRLCRQSSPRAARRRNRCRSSALPRAQAGRLRELGMS